ncbi:hypothetical protein [Paenibacillus piri]|uniref:Permuted papain-like amidase YaeF/Yiix C92 family enzyme n=1 Tax=Paenibacillus piri TaxID=2547395 RepID=A0A4R5KE62_9BACL|nr:hypothetical protein [Paenibacillus piri]TDF92507.1 hypothetical protein E1757_29400 [Paenibacillus piri]
MIEYIKNQNSENSIYVLLTDTGTLFTKLIKQFTAAPYNHASLALDAELNELFSFGRKQATNPWSAGFVQEDVYEGTFRHFPGTRCQLLRLHVSKRQRTNAVRIIQSFQNDQQAYRYNLIGLLGVLVNLDIEQKNAYFCSQFVAEALRSTGLSLWDRPSSLVTPEDIRRHPAFETLYEGYLFDYPLLDGERLSRERNGAELWRRQAV